MDIKPTPNNVAIRPLEAASENGVGQVNPYGYGEQCFMATVVAIGDPVPQGVKLNAVVGDTVFVDSGCCAYAPRIEDVIVVSFYDVKAVVVD